MRVTLNSMYNSVATSSSKHYSALSDAMEHSQYRVLQSKDDPLTQGTIISLNNSISELSIYENASMEIESSLKESEIKMNGVYNRMLNISDIFNKANGGSVGEADFNILSKDLRSAEQDIVNILNSKDINGNYIFGGTDIEKAPFQKELVSIDVDGDGTFENIEMYIYKGNDKAVMAKSGTTTSLPTTIDGSTVITNDNGKTIFEAIAIANYYYEQGLPIPESKYPDIQKSLESIMETFVNVKSDLGVNLQQAQSNNRMYGNMKTEYQSLLSNSQDADFVEITTKIRKEQQVMQVISSTTKIMMEMASLSFTK